MGLELKNIFVDKSGKLTDASKIGGALLAGAGAALLLSKAKKKKADQAATTDQTTVQTTDTYSANVGASNQPAKSNTMLFVGLGIGAIVLIGGVYFLTSKK